MWRVIRSTAGLVPSWLAQQTSANTRAAYETDMRSFTQWCDDNGRTVLAANAGDVDDFREACIAAGASSATVARRLSGIGSFFRYASDAGAVPENPALRTSRPQLERRVTVALDENEIEAVVAAAERISPKAAALVALLAVEGIKLNTVLAIDVPSIHRGRRSLCIEVERRGERDHLAVADRSASAIAAYVANRTHGPLFLGDSAVRRGPARLTRFGADFLIKRAAATCGIDKAVSANALRRSYVNAQRRSGTPLADIADRAGHRDARATARLLDHSA